MAAESAAGPKTDVYTNRIMSYMSDKDTGWGRSIQQLYHVEFSVGQRSILRGEVSIFSRMRNKSRRIIRRLLLPQENKIR